MEHATLTGRFWIAAAAGAALTTSAAAAAASSTAAAAAAAVLVAAAAARPCAEWTQGESCSPGGRRFGQRPARQNTVLANGKNMKVMKKADAGQGSTPLAALTYFGLSNMQLLQLMLAVESSNVLVQAK